MAFLTYLDASGDAIDPSIRAISVGGFVGHEDDWAKFEDCWRAVLDRFEVSELHMRNYVGCHGEFANWKGDEARRADFLGSLASVITDCNLQPLGATIPLSVYRLFNKHYCIEEAIGVPYTLAATSAVAMSVDWRDRNRTAEPVLFFIERGDNEQADMKQFLKRVLWDSDPEYQVAEPVFMPKKRLRPDGNVEFVYPFQACDFIAYEQAKAVTDMIVKRKMMARKSFQKLMKPIEEIPEGRTYWTILEKRSFEKSIKVRGVPRRYNHFRRCEGRNQALDPYCFVNGEPVVAYFYDGGYLEPEDRGGLRARKRDF